LFRTDIAAGLAIAFLAAAGAGLTAEEAADGAIAVERAWARPMPAGSEVGAGYLMLRNTGETPDRLVAVTSERAERAEIHETTMVDDVMRMRPLGDGLEIAPGATVELAPGGLHIMFHGVAEPFAAGERFPARLVFQQGGERAVTFEVVGRAPPLRTGDPS
jgi:periplasmic copper chaperone A